MTPASPAWLRDQIVGWFGAHARELPWRSDPQPYHVLLSELMLQQTRVETVLPYYESFLERWPSLEALASAREDEVLTAWAGLGYYRRARALHAAARAAVAQGGLKGDLAALRSLPGVGPYTAGALASIAFGVPAAAVDGNVERVLARVDGFTDDPATPASRRALAARALAISAPGVASAVTQGMMELGAVVCRPRQPLCSACPWSAHCVGRALGIADTLPAKRAKAPPRPAWAVSGVLVHEGRVLLARRPPGLLGGLWEPPGADHAEGENPEHVLAEAWRERVGGKLGAVRRLGEVEHVFTHRRLQVTVFAVDQATTGRGNGSYEEVGWFSRSAPGVGLSRLAQKVLATRSEDR